MISDNGRADLYLQTFSVPNCIADIFRYVYVKYSNMA